MAVESSTAATGEATTFTSSREGPTWSKVQEIFTPRILPKPFMVFDNYGFTVVIVIYDIVHRCKGFRNIVTAQPSLFLP